MDVFVERRLTEPLYIIALLENFTYTGNLFRRENAADGIARWRSSDVSETSGRRRRRGRRCRRRRWYRIAFEH